MPMQPLKLLNTVQGLSHVECIAVIYIKGEPCMNDNEPGMSQRSTGLFVHKSICVQEATDK